MSVIQKIRTKYAKLAGGVIAFALVAFILMDALSSKTSVLFGNDRSVAKVNGEKIDYLDYTRRTRDYEVLYGSNREIDENFRNQIYGMALDDLIKEKLVDDQSDKLGLTVTDAEKKDLIYGNDPDQGVKSYQPFTNPNTKAFDPQYVKLFEEQADQLDPTGKAREHWETYKAYILRNSLSKKFNSLFSAAAYVPSFLAKARADQQAEVADIDYVSVQMDNMSDEDVTLTDEDYKKYINEHKAEFENENNSRSMHYVMFSVIPSGRDTARALGALNSIKEDFVNAKDDESFVNRNSEESYKGNYLMKSDYKSKYVDSVFAMSVGQVMGPVYEGDAYKLIKLEDRKLYPDSVKCRHILIKTQDRGQAVLTDSTARNRMDSVIAAIKGGASFTEMVQKYSDDDGSKEKGGEYTFPFSQKVGLSKEFADFIFDGKTGQTKMVKVENNAYAGYHFIEILWQGEEKPALKLATITKALFASDETENEIFAQANEFASEATSAALFDSTASKTGVQKLAADDIKVNDFTIYNIGPCREVIRWMYDSEVGDVSQVFALNSKYVVAKLTAINKKGMKPLTDDLKMNIEAQVKYQKKGEMLTKKYSDKKSLEEIAKETSGQVQSFDSFRGNNSFSGPIGYAPKVIGYSFYDGFKPGSLSPALPEQNAVYFIKLKKRYESPDSDTTFAKREEEMMKMETQNAIKGQEVEQLKKNADIKYNPDNF